MEDGTTLKRKEMSEILDEILASLNVVSQRTNQEDGTREIVLGCCETIHKSEILKIINHPDFIAIGPNNDGGGLVITATPENDRQALTRKAKELKKNNKDICCWSDLHKHIKRDIQDIALSINQCPGYVMACIIDDIEAGID